MRAILPITSNHLPSKFASRIRKTDPERQVEIAQFHGRRRGLTDTIFAATANAARSAGLLAIIWIGETDGERTDGMALSVCADQIIGSVPDGIASLAIAYEPLWAIGSGRTPASQQIAEMHQHIRQCLLTRLGADGRSVRILHGGSVNSANARDILSLSEVGGT